MSANKLKLLWTIVLVSCPFLVFLEIFKLEERKIVFEVGYYVNKMLIFVTEFEVFFLKKIRILLNVSAWFLYLLACYSFLFLDIIFDIIFVNVLNKFGLYFFLPLYILLSPKASAEGSTPWSFTSDPLARRYRNWASDQSLSAGPALSEVTVQSKNILKILPRQSINCTCL